MSFVKEPQKKMVVLKNTPQAEEWLAQQNWKDIGQSLTFLTLGHRGHQICGWSGCFESFTNHNGGHFEASEEGDEQLFEITSNDEHVITYVHNAVIDALKAVAQLELIPCIAIPAPDQHWRLHIEEPCHIYLPVRRKEKRSSAH